jgi:heme exporter protein A
VARGGIALMEGLDLVVGAEQALIVRGANGLGKTTLLRTIAGLQPPLSGEITAFGHEGQAATASELIAYASHSDGLKPTLTARETLAFWGEVYATDRVDDALDAMNLRGLEHRAAMTLSAGQKRRLGLARLKVTGRPIWVLDEPTVSLDVDSVALFATAVRTHLAQGGSALIATHIDLGLHDAQVVDLTPFKARPPEAGGLAGGFDEAFI